MLITKLTPGMFKDQKLPEFFAKLGIWFPGGYDTKAQVRENWKRALKSGMAAYFVAFDDCGGNLLVGLCGCQCEITLTKGGLRTYTVTDLYVLPEYEHLGVREKLLNCIVREAIREGAPSVRAVIDSDHRKLYEKELFSANSERLYVERELPSKKYYAIKDRVPVTA